MLPRPPHILAPIREMSSSSVLDPWPWIRIRIRGSMPLTNGSGSGSGSWIRILLYSSLTFKMPTKNNFCLNIFSAYYHLKVHLHNFLKIKSQKESQNSMNQGFSYYFCMMTEGFGSGSIPLTNGSGSGRLKNMWIRCRLPWLINCVLVYDPKCGGGIAGSQPMSMGTAAHLEPK
jgi:hypothetical protein